VTATPELLPPPPVSATPQVARATIGTVLRQTRFLLLAVGQTVSQFGDKLHHMALIALVGAGATAETGALELAKLSLVFTAPVVLFGPLAGALVDRWNKRVTMIVCDALRAMLVFSFPLLYHASDHLWLVYVAAFFVFLLGLFFNSAKMAVIPDLVARHELLPANAALNFVGRFATVGGILGGGLIIASPFWSRFGWTGYVAGFYLDAASYVISVITLLAIAALFREKRRPQTPLHLKDIAVRRGPGTLMRDVGATLRVVAAHSELRFVFFTSILLALFAASVYVAMTVSVQTVMGKGTVGVGYLGGLLAGGMIVGSLLVGTVGSHFKKEKLILVCTGIIGCLMILGGVFFSFRMFAPIAIVGGMLLAPLMVAQDTLLHEHAPPESRGLIFSTRDVILSAVFVMAAFAVGGGIFLFGKVGVEEPYRLALVVFGAVIALAAVTGGVLAQPKAASITRGADVPFPDDAGHN
jgi:MFS transporter, DHA3 family, macrolide efflux protein